MTDSLGRSVWYSIGFHVAIAALIFMRTIFMPTDNVEVRDAIRVDVVDLPMKSSEAKLPTPEPAAPPKPAPPTPPAPVPEAKTPPPPPAAKMPAPMPPPVSSKMQSRAQTRAQNEALLKLKALEKLDQFKKDLAQPAPPKPEPVRGNRLAQGNALSGLERLDYDAYFGQIRSQIFSHWSLPTWMADAEFKATVTVLIDDRGFVTKKIMRQSSGNDIFDNKALEAIDASSPFAPPPARLRGLLSTTGINFKFPQ